MIEDTNPALLLRLGDIAALHQSGSGPTLVWLSGYSSDMNGTKASWLAQQCAIWSYDYMRFDYRGTGQSAGVFHDMTLSDWLDDTLAVIDQLTDRPLILIGSSMGGWLGLKAATLRPNRVKALALIAPAPDFTDQIWHTLNETERADYAATGSLPDDGRFVAMTYKLMKDGNDNHLLLKKPIAFDGPVEIIHGLRDALVPNETPYTIVDLLASEDVTLHLVKDGAHDLSRPQDLDILWQMITRLREKISVESSVPTGEVGAS